MMSSPIKVCTLALHEYVLAAGSDYLLLHDTFCCMPSSTHLLFLLHLKRPKITGQAYRDSLQLAIDVL